MPRGTAFFHTTGEKSGLRLPGARPQSIRQRVEECVMAELSQHGARSTRDLLMALTAKGIDPAPSAKDFKDRRNVLSTMLSKAKDRFTNDRAARVWRMAQPIDSKETPSSPDAATQRGEWP